MNAIFAVIYQHAYCPLFCATVVVDSRPLVVFRFRAVVLAVGGMGGRGCR